MEESRCNAILMFLWLTMVRCATEKKLGEYQQTAAAGTPSFLLAIDEQ